MRHRHNTEGGVVTSSEEQRLKPTALALDSIQKFICNIAEAIQIWKKLEQDLPADSRDAKMTNWPGSDIIPLYEKYY
jgi:hypothetical protein